MDPPALINEGSFRSTNPNSYNMAEIWPFPINAGGGGGNVAAPEGGGSELIRRPHQLGPSFGHQFGDAACGGNANLEAAVDDCIVVDQRGSHGGSSRKRRDAFAAAPEDDSGKLVSTSCGSGMNNCSGKRLKATKPRDGMRDSKAEGEVSSGKGVEQNPNPSEPPKQDYIHVRARRGQATDSHSLAERARREKISERMKILQDIVPGCNKVIGKALVLDEIINYIQSLQRQVEFLSMKLEAVTSRINPGIDAFPPKDVLVNFLFDQLEFGQQAFDAAGISFGSQAAREYGRGSSPEWLHMQVGGGFERTT